MNGLNSFLPEYELAFRPDAKEEVHAVAGWGLKHTAAKAIKIAQQKQVPYMALEDAFLRSYGLGVHGSAPFSMVADDVGIYYDATKPSRLEQMISEDNSVLIGRAKANIEEIKRQRLSKYNNSLEKWTLPKGKYVLAVDQCEGDYSIRYGLGGKESFRKMLEKARAENEGANIIIKVHPDVIAGKRKGYLQEYARKGDVLLTENINPHVIFENVEKVYTVTSLLGMEALMFGLPVRCFGMPFYAGWGASVDENSIERRRNKRKVEEIFAAAYIRYSRYIDPYLQMPSTIENCIDGLSFIKDYYAKHKRNYYCLGFSGWKRGFVEPYIKSAANEVKYFRSSNSAAKAAVQDANGALLVWAAREKPELKELAGATPILRMEDGFIRSAGLGSDLIAANSLIIDKSSIHFNHSQASDIENILNNKNYTEEELRRAQKLLDEVTANSVSKYNLQGNAELTLPEGKKKILVVGQVESDASIRFGAVDIRTNQALIDKVRQQNPDSYLIYKPHPDVISGNRKGKVKGQVAETGADAVITDMPIHKLFRAVDEVHVITSLAGFEALMLGRKVVCHGIPFYHGWGLTEGLPTPRRTRQRTRLELFAAAIIDYASYYDFSVSLPCRPEVIVGKIAQNKLARQKKRKYTRALNWVRMSVKR